MQMASECCFVAGCARIFRCQWFYSVVLSLVAHGLLYVSGFGVVLSPVAHGFLDASGFRMLFCLWLLMDFCMQVASKCCFVSGCSRIFVCKWFQSVVWSPVALGFWHASGFRLLFCPRLLMDF